MERWGGSTTLLGNEQVAQQKVQQSGRGEVRQKGQFSGEKKG